MATGYYLRDNKNPRASNGFHGHVGRNVPMSQVNVALIHVAVTVPTTQSAQAVGNYFRTTDRPVSYHTLYDSGGRFPLLPYTDTAFHVRNYNSKSIGLSFACNTDTWSRYQNWAELAYKAAAPDVKQISESYNLPYVLLSRSDVLAGKRGFSYHALMDPSRRTDPGAPPHGTFNINHLFDLARGGSMTTPAPVVEGVSLKQGDKGRRVAQLQHLVNRVITRTGGWPTNEGDIVDKKPLLTISGVYDPATAERVQHAIWRVERWVLKHPIYADEDGGSRVTPQTEAWLVHALGSL